MLPHLKTSVSFAYKTIAIFLTRYTATQIAASSYV